MSAEVPEPEKVCSKCEMELFRLDGNKDWRTIIGFKGSCKKGGPHTPADLPIPEINWDDWDSVLTQWSQDDTLG